MNDIKYMGVADPMFAARRASKLPKTGQTTSYRTGDDGSVKAGKDHRFRVQNNLIFDDATGLCWVANPAAIIPGDANGYAIGVPPLSGTRSNWSAATNYVYGDLVYNNAGDLKYYVCIVPHINQAPPNATYWVETVWTASAADLTHPSTMSWNNAIDRCLALNYGGFVGWSTSNPLGWRLPNPLEALSIIRADFTPAIYSIFTITLGESWTSSRAQPSEPNSMIYVNEYVFAAGRKDKANVLYVRPVRSLS